MSHDAQEQPDFEQAGTDPAESLDMAPPAADDGDGLRNHAGLISWVSSGALHATVIMLMGTVYFLVREADVETPPVKIISVPPSPERQIEKPKMKRDLLDPTVTIDVPKESTDPSPLTDLQLPVEIASSEDDSAVPNTHGNENAVSDMELGSTGAFMTIGVGGPAKGIFGNRGPGGKKRAISGGGGGRQGENAVNAALRWFKRHQSPNGQWDAERYFQNCTEAQKCEPGSFGDRNAEEVNTAMTGYAVLAFLGSGYDHKTPNTYRQTVKKGIDYLLSIQKPDGLFGSRNYEHPVATMALAQAYAMSGDPDLRGPAQKGVDIILARQNKDDGAKMGESGGGGLGWDYATSGQRNDASVTGWNVMALKSAHAAGLNTGSGIDGAKAWLERSWKANNDGRDGRADWRNLDPYTGESVFSYTWPSGATGYAKDGFGHQNMAPVGLLCAVFMGHKAGDPMLESLANTVSRRQLPSGYPTNTYYMYYNTFGMFQVGGERWKTWNARMSSLLVNAQRTGDGCLDGSWDPAGTGPAAQIGRVLNTAYCTLCLEVYYFYGQIGQDGGKR